MTSNNLFFSKGNKYYVVSLILKFILVTVGGYGLIAGLIPTPTYGGPHNALYYTWQSNLWVILYALIGIVIMAIEKVKNKKIVRPWMKKIKLIVTVAITLTGLTFYCVLIPYTYLTPGVYEFNPWVAPCVINHMVVPILAVADFFIYDSDYPYEKKDGVLGVITPLYYLVFSSVGYVLHWDFKSSVNGGRAPYFFLDWGNPAGAVGFSSEFPYVGICYWGTALSVFVILAGILYVKLANKIKINREKKEIK